MEERMFAKLMGYVFTLFVIIFLMAIANIDIVLVLALIFSDDGSNGNAISHVIQPWDSGAKWLLAIAIIIVILALNTFVKIKGIHVFQVVGTGISILMVGTLVAVSQLSFWWKVILLVVSMYIVLKVRQMVYRIFYNISESKVRRVTQAIKNVLADHL
ncbi:hypothetical protein [Weissella minor]|uniref:hypothetical protein n=1 Tax=Weissella minor TaxID=1620 RepID=UPI003AF2E170